MREDWPSAMGLSTPTANCFAAKNCLLAEQAAKRQIGFTPTEVDIAVSENGDRATAIAVFRDLSGPSQKRYRDGATLKRTGPTWAVILRPNFGAAAVPVGRNSKGRKPQ